jgi:hypothetical protein
MKQENAIFLDGFRDFLRQETCESETSQGHARVSWAKFWPIEGRTGFGRHVDVGLTSAMPEKRTTDA